MSANLQVQIIFNYHQYRAENKDMIVHRGLVCNSVFFQWFLQNIPYTLWKSSRQLICSVVWRTKLSSLMSYDQIQPKMEWIWTSSMFPGAMKEEVVVRDSRVCYVFAFNHAPALWLNLPLCRQRIHIFWKKKTAVEFYGTELHFAFKCTETSVCFTSGTEIRVQPLRTT